MVVTEQRSSSAVIGDFALRGLARRLTGNIIVSDDAGYDDARRIFNARIDRRPAAIVQVANAQDVARTIDFARENGLPLAVRGGGHHGAGYSLVDDGVVIDMQLLKSVQVDVERLRARAGTGLRAGEYVGATERLGLVSPVGDAAHTGIAGLTLGGGYGWLSGKLGMVIDNLESAEIVTADGQILRASATEHPDLFWGLRGGSGNFGVVTQFEYRLTPLKQVLGGMLVYPFAVARDALRLYREVTAGAPDELTTYIVMATMPGGAPIVAIMLCYSGEDMAEGERVIAPLRAFGPLLADMVHPMPYSAMVHMTDDFAPEGLARDEAWINVGGLPDELIDDVVALADPARAMGNSLIIKQLNGAARRVDPMATAFPHRYAPYSVVPLAAWPVGLDGTRHSAWVQAVRDAARPVTRGVYVNGADHDAIESVYGVNYPRLVGIKNRYDPDNVFSSTYNVVPTKA